jgi:hypothetical protein
MQSYAMQHSRLHIPVISGVDAVHGFGHPWQAALFLQSIGMGATWDPSVAKAGGEVTANALRATGWNWDFAPESVNVNEALSGAFYWVAVSFWPGRHPDDGEQLAGYAAVGRKRDGMPCRRLPHSYTRARRTAGSRRLDTGTALRQPGSMTSDS